MLKSHIAAWMTAPAIVIAAGLAMAQTNPTPSGETGAGTMNKAPEAQGGAEATKGAGNIQYITQNRPDLWRASKLQGVNVYNEQDEHIGDIDEVLVDRNGKAEAVVIGVGGFLGIGERDVAVPFNALRWAMNDRDNVASRDGNDQNASRQARNGEAGGNATTATQTQDGTATTADNRADGNNRYRDYPARAILPGATKDQLEKAPEFRYAG
jgi:PRC-barrel domain